LQVSQWLRNSQFWLLPGLCVVCHKPSHRKVDLCVGCEAGLPRIIQPCPTCALPLPPGDHSSPVCGRCLNQPRRMTRAVGAFGYEEPVSSLVAGFKYRAALQQGRVLGDLLADRIRDVYREQALPELIVPVPLHPTRLRERGFNQAVVLARQLGRGLQIPVSPEALLRVLHTQAQQGLSAKERKRNLRGAFRLDMDLRPYSSIALVDDVVTTMSTMRELARVIRRAHPGEPEVHVWCLARA
jgi:ComF family protein